MVQIPVASLWMVASPGDTPEPMKCPDHSLRAYKSRERFDRCIIPVEIVKMDDVRRIISKLCHTPIRPLEPWKPLFGYVVQARMI